jgi:hypothetical protein
MLCRNRRSLIVPPSRTLEQRPIIMPVGTRIWKDIKWDGWGRRGIINTDLSSIYRYMYPGMVFVGGLMRAARS